ncbi:MULTISPECIES: class II aldolase/adducin family protein [unclassified Sinorhizobium]|uniref:class II aldolase/adducin family protein n=1 Tax=unclassified Sinorhizobium TaxID=2613772 RepID=UPI0035253173
MSDLQTVLAELVTANHILANEDVLDAFGHVSIRSPEAAGEYLISRSRSPELVTAADIQRYDLDSNLLGYDERRGYIERVIHGGILKLRPDVMAVCHFHSPAIMPFCVADIPWIPVTHLAATLGISVPVWDSQDEFGDTDMLISTPEQAASMARTLGNQNAVLLRGHGAVVVGRSVRELVMRSIQLCRNGDVLMRTRLHANPKPLSEREVALSGAKNLEAPVLARAWDYWAARAAQAH